MNLNVNEISIYPYATDEDGDIFNCGEPDEAEGWSVHAFASDGQCDDYIDEKDFDDYEDAYQYAVKLSARYDVGIDHRY